MHSRRTVELVGRQEELAALSQAWRSACEGDGPSGLLVQGPAGVGKSRLIEHAAASLVRPGSALVVGHCVDLYGYDMPYGSAAEAVRDLIRQYGIEAVRAWSGPFMSALASLIPEVDPTVTEVGPGRLLEGFAALLGRLAADRPTWLWIEDLHWSDRGTRALVSWVMRTVRAPHLLVTCTLRTQERTTPPDVTDFWTELRKLPHVAALELLPFGHREVGAHWQALAGRRPPQALVERVRELSGGLPFYTELLADSGWRADQPLPPSLRELAATPLARLGTAGRRVVQAASVEDGRLRHDVLRDVVGADGDLDSGVAEAVAAGVLSAEAGGEGYRFRHALIREAVLASLLPAEQARWHAAWARRLEDASTLADDPFARIAAAHHWVRADAPARALDAALAAADFAGRILALDEEAKLLQEAYELWPRMDDAESRTGYSRDDLLRSVVVLLAFLPDPPALLHVIDRALATTRSDPVRDAVLREFRRRFRDADDVPAVDAAGVDAASVEVLLTAPLDHPWLPRAATELSYQFHHDDPDVAERLTRRAVASAGLLAAGTPAPRAYLPLTPAIDVVIAQSGVAALRHATGDVEEAARIWKRVPRDVGLRQIASHLDWYLAEAQWTLGQHREAIAALQQALDRIVEPHRAPLLWGGVMVRLTESQLALGRWDDAGRTLARCQEVLLDDARNCQALALAGLLACWRGRREEAATLLGRVEASPTADPEPVDLVRPRWLAAQLAADRGDVAGLRAALDPLWLDDGWEVVSDHLWQPLLLELRVEVDLLLQPAGANAHLGTARERIELCRRVGARLHRTGDTGTAWHAQLDGELKLADGHVEPWAWDAVGAAWNKIGQVHDEAWARLRQAACLAMRKERDEALARVAAVQRTASDLRAAPLADAAAALRARISSTGRSNSLSGGGLTRREREVLQLLALGRSNRQIARELFISEKTVSVHVSAVLAKLHAASRTEAVATAQRHGLLTVPGQGGTQPER